MTLFWHNHFTSSLEQVKAPVLLYRQNALLRRHALGNFATLLREVARDPAMLVYLDNAESRRQAPNENFARELLELFTLGEGRYARSDERRVGKECVSTCSSRWSPYPYKTKNNRHNKKLTKKR